MDNVRCAIENPFSGYWNNAEQILQVQGIKLIFFAVPSDLMYHYLN